MSGLGEIRRLIDAAAGRAMQLVRRGIVRSASASGFLQAEGFAGERFSDVEHWQQYGLASRPPAGSEVLLAQVDGQAEQAIAFATTSRASRPADLEASEARLYGPEASQAVRMRSSGDVDVEAASGQTVNVGGPTAAVAALLGATFNTAMGTYLSAMVSAGTTWTASPKLLADVVTYITAHVSAITALNASHTAGWLSSKVKVA